MGLDGVKALVIEHRLDEAVRRRIAVDGRDDVGAERLADRRLVLERIAHRPGGSVRADTSGWSSRSLTRCDDRRFQRVVVQDGRIDEGRELGLAPRHLFGLVADARPDRIDLVERARRPSSDTEPWIVLRNASATRRLKSFSTDSAGGHRAANAAHGQWLARLKARCARKSSTPALNTLSPTASMWSRPGISSACAPGMSAASSCAEPAIVVLGADRDQHRRARCAPTCSRRQRLARAADAGGERPQVGFGLLGEGAEHAAGRIGDVGERRRLQRLGDARRQTRRRRPDGCRARRGSPSARAPDGRARETRRCARPSSSP